MGRHITVETALRSHPKFKRLRRAAGLTERDALGALALLWITVRDVSPDGRLPSWDADDIDEAAGTPGIFQHLVSVGFIKHNGDLGLVCHDWMDHSGKQCQDAERKRVEREKKAKVSTDSPRTVHGASPPEGNGREGNGQEGNGRNNPMAVSDEPAVLELILSEPPPDDGTCTPSEWLEVHSEFYGLYPRKVKRPDSQRAWKKIKPQDDVTFNAIMDGLEAWAAHWALKVDRDKIPYPATWLNARQWEDRP